MASPRPIAPMCRLLRQASRRLPSSPLPHAFLQPRCLLPTTASRQTHSIHQEPVEPTARPKRSIWPDATPLVRRVRLKSSRGNEEAAAPPTPEPQLAQQRDHGPPPQDQNDHDHDPPPQAKEDARSSLSRKRYYINGHPLKPIDPKPHYLLTFTCKPCGTRSRHKISKQGYHFGSVLATCPECRNRHIMSDHLGIFSDTRLKGYTIEDILRERGQLVKKGTLGEDGNVEFWDDGSVSRHEPADVLGPASEGDGAAPGASFTKGHGADGEK